PLTRQVAIRVGFDVGDPTFGRAISPLRGLVGLSVFKAGESALALPVAVHPIVAGIQKFLLVIIMTWLALRLIEVMSQFVRRRLPERSVITVPNAQFLTVQVENLQERDRILFNTTLRLRYETSPDQLRWVLVRIRALLDTHPRLDPDSSRVRFSGFGASSLDVELFVYVRTR